jgi:hypothetical protein
MNLRNKWKETNGIGKISFSILVFSIVMVVIYGIFLGWEPSSDAGDWGNFGSYFASITGLLAFSGVLYTASLSEKRADEEKERRMQAETHTKDIEKKAEEDSIKREERELFFKLLELHQEKLKSISYKEVVSNNSFFLRSLQSTKLPPTVTMLKGVDACEKYNSIVNSILYDYQINDCVTKIGNEKYSDFSDLSTALRISVEKFGNNYAKIKEYIISNIENPNLYQMSINKEIFFSKTSIYHKNRIDYDIIDLYKAMKFSGNIMNIKYGQIFGQYYRNMFYVLETCNQFRYNKEYYFKLFRAQLSRVEIILCLLNAISDKSSPKFVKLLDDNNILDDLYYRDLVSIKFDHKYKGKELQFVKDMLNLYLEEHEEHKESN